MEKIRGVGKIKEVTMDIKALKRLVADFKVSTMQKQIEGDTYYRTKNISITNREKTFWGIGQNRMLKDYTKANNILASNFTRIIVDQKVQYSINKKMVIEGIEEFVDIKKFKKTLGKLARNASNQIYAVLQWYIDNGELKYKILPSQQCILIHNADDNTILDMVIRVYSVAGKEHVDVITKSTVETYNEEYKLIDTKNHLRKNIVAGDREIESNAIEWDVLPITVLYNNDINQTDLEMFKTYVDAYDFANSDFFNNLEDFQEMYWILKGYDGQNPEEFMAEFKRSRILKVGENGDAQQVAQEVPYQARQVALDIAKKDIYRFGMGVDPESIKGDTTNVTIKALFANLDLKANHFEMQIEEFMEQVIEVVNAYAGLTNKGTITDYEITFNRETIINKESLLETLQKLGVKISNDTLLKNTPIVEDIEEENALLDAEKEKENKSLGGNLGFGDE